MNVPVDKSSPSRPRRLADVGRWDMETDVAIIGFGGSGAAAAIEASDQGAAVTIFDLASASGGSTALSSAEIYMGGNGGTRVQRACGLEDSTEDMYQYLMAANGPLADPDKVRAYCEGSLDHFNWLVGLGVPYKDTLYNQRAIMALTDDCLLYTGSEKAWPYNRVAKPCPRGHNLQVEGDNGGPLFMKIMTENVEKRGVKVVFEARALTLIVDDERRVHGVVVRIDQQERCVRARRGVILCAGGFAMNQEMLRKYSPLLLAASEPIGNPGDTGSGIQMGMAVGAAAINMHEGFVSLPYYPPSSLTWGILVNAQGQRFVNEDCYHGRVGYYCLCGRCQPGVVQCDQFGRVVSVGPDLSEVALAVTVAVAEDVLSRSDPVDGHPMHGRQAPRSGAVECCAVASLEVAHRSRSQRVGSIMRRMRPCSPYTCTHIPSRSAWTSAERTALRRLE